MDIKTIAEGTGLDEMEYLEILDLFVKSTSFDLAKLQQAVDKRDPQEVFQAAHSIKGAAMNFNFLDIYDVANRIEMSAREHCLAGVSEAIRAIDERMKIIILMLQGSRKKHGEESQQGGSGG